MSISLKNREEGSEPIHWGNIRFFPVLHGKVEFAISLRKEFENFRPDCIAVEFPSTLKDRIIQAVKRLPLLSVVHYQEEDGLFIYLLIEPTDPLIEAIRLAIENQIPVHFIDRDTEGYPLYFEPAPDPYAINKIGYYRFCRLYIKNAPKTFYDIQDILREKTMAYHLQQLNRRYHRVLWVGGMYHVKGILDNLSSPQTQVIGKVSRKGVDIAHLHEESSREIMSEMPYLAVKYELFRQGKGEAPDRLRINSQLIDEASKIHQKKNKEEVSSRQLKILFRFARNYALITGALTPNFYQLLIASRGAVDDNFAYEVWELGSHYIWQSNNPGLPVLRLEGEDLFLDQKRIRFHRQLKTFRRRLVPVPIKKLRASKQEQKEWKRRFKGIHICSYPPEDVVVEGYGRYLQKKALEIRAEENLRIVPFISSMLDGLDIRETLRKWYKGEIYVREEMPLRGKVGSVVIIFDPDLPDKEGKEKFPWKVTWLGEHDQESDMSFYSTPAGEVMVGPGISRCIYGGFMLTYPPLRVYDIWKDPYFDTARNKPERLLMAALDYSLEKNVVYVAPDPPSGWCQSFASRLGKKIIYMPIGIFSPITLKKIRQFHVLDGHHVRRYARFFIT